MLKKIILGVLLVTVIGAGGTALAYNIATQETEVVATTPAPLANGQGYNAEQAGQQPDQVIQMFGIRHSLAEISYPPNTKYQTLNTFTFSHIHSAA